MLHAHHYIVSSWERTSRDGLAQTIDRMARYELARRHGRALFLLRKRRLSAATVYARRFGALPDFLRQWALPKSQIAATEYARWLNGGKPAETIKMKK